MEISFGFNCQSESLGQYLARYAMERELWACAKAFSSKRKLNSSLLIHQLPPEILGDIFEFVSIGNQICEDNSWPCRTLSSVCQWWRSVATARTSLWSSIVFVDLRGGGREFERSGSFPWIKMCLDRSREADLDIRIVADVDDTVTRSHVEVLGALLHPHWPRLRHVHLELPHDILCRYRHSFEWPLKRLRTWAVSSSSPGVGRTPFDPFHSSEESQPINPAAPILEKLSLSSIRMAQAIVASTLQFVPTIQELELGLHHLWSESVPKITLPNLKKLTIQTRMIPFSPLNIIAPQLTDFKMTFPESRAASGGKVCWRQMADAFLASPGWFPQLRRLDISDIGHSHCSLKPYGFAVAALIRSHPLIEELHLTCSEPQAYNLQAVHQVLEKAYTPKVVTGLAHFDRVWTPGRLKKLDILCCPDASLEDAISDETLDVLRQRFLELLESSPHLVIKWRISFVNDPRGGSIWDLASPLLDLSSCHPGRFLRTIETNVG